MATIGLYYIIAIFGLGTAIQVLKGVLEGLDGVETIGLMLNATGLVTAIALL